MKIKRYALIAALTNGEIKAICREAGVSGEVTDERLDEIVLNYFNGMIFDSLSKLRTKYRDIAIEEAGAYASSYARRRNASSSSGAIPEHIIEMVDAIKFNKEQEETVTKAILHDAVELSDNWLMVKNPFPSKREK